ncbi:galactose-inhibitable lectin 35 kDa subunit precursor, putative [Entamoeba dispar SAW760]|uniref:Galactose-inhibitable lectin 35 kDa subunit, putative n=3 Tax=Entamoeba dispar TaxID=46681 RepID=B0E7Z8_ENTDS|nr:galactose-inhibitable lectin 35 kDa subunit precursor, putative [Entamoeba dispar SAW760]AAB50230.1 Gal/GalNAc lectin light subunit [Entamoeba dispar]EDR29348.1 galactose-inhibitable lectin 35 kDa subunit precursor, putative [Entamoeba dispar SAW760]|eukprot:EDR29348.1 galactose-inhibitable lectin 35 kDa subunit precursor, putative [Entamoeba dispar SAW760]
MIALFLLIVYSIGKTSDNRDQFSTNYPYGMNNYNTNFNSEFTSDVNSYQIQRFAENGVFSANQENYVRAKCKTCCRVIFASDYNYKTQRQFTDADDINGDTRYVMDMEFDDKRSVRYPNGNYEQNILLRPLKQGNELQFFEFAPYRMYTCYSMPKRVHDIRGGANEGSTLIIWSKNPPLSDAPGTQNQRFVYVHPYPNEWYAEYHSTIEYNQGGRWVKKTLEWPTYKRHFYLPYRLDLDLCYQAKKASDGRSVWTGNQHLKTLTNGYQITASRCSATESRQIFIPVFA